MDILQEEPSFDAPIPGMSLTHELGDRPWQTPAQYSTVDEAMSFYLPKLSSENFAAPLLQAMELGVPLTNLANSIQISGVMEGIHSLDVGILVIPVLVETMMLLGDSAGIDYVTGMEKTKTLKDGTVKQAALNKISAMNNQDKEENLIVEEKVSIKPEEDSVGGLMSRRQQ